MPHYGLTPEQQQQMAYQQYMQNQQQGVGGQYPMPPQGMMPQQPKLRRAYAEMKLDQNDDCYSGNSKSN